MKRALVAAVALLAPASAFCEEWEYILQGKNVRAGSLVLGRSGDQSWLQFKFDPKHLNDCVSGNVPATVTRGAEHITIEMTPLLGKCETVRFVIRNDGEGGRREVLRDGSWTWDGLERSLRSTGPARGPAAKVRFLRNTGGFSFSTIDLRTCPKTSTLREVVARIAVRPTDDTGASIKMIGTPAQESATWRHRSVRAGEPFRFVASSVRAERRTTYYCNRAGSFLPADGSEYEVAAGEHEETCSLSVVRLSLAADGATVVRTPEATFRDYGAPPRKFMGPPRWDPEDFCGKP